MSRWLATAAALAALLLPTLAGCGSSSTTGGSGKGAPPTDGAAANTGKSSDTGKSTPRGGHNDPG